MKGFEPGLIEKLIDDAPGHEASGSVPRALTLEQYKEAVARDLEGLLNSRSVIADDVLGSYPECRRSLATYGLRDFSSMSLASDYDRAGICRALEEAVARHEPRLSGVEVRLEPGAGPGGGLHFTIHALLELHPAREPVNFDAMLQPGTLQYSVSRLRRQAG